MHVLKHGKTPKPAPVVPILSHFKVPHHRRLRGRRYDANGKFMYETGPKRTIDVAAQRALRDAYAAAAKMPRPEEGGAFDLNRYHPLPGKVLLKRGPLITEEKGVAIPEDQQRFVSWWFVIRVGANVVNCDVGDRVVLQKKHKPKQARLGEGRFHIARDACVVGIVSVE